MIAFRASVNITLTLSLFFETYSCSATFFPLNFSQGGSIKEYLHQPANLHHLCPQVPSVAESCWSVIHQN